MLPVGCSQLFQGRQAAADLFGFDAVGQPDIPFHAEGVAGHQQQVIVPGTAAEGVGVGSKPRLVRASYRMFMLVSYTDRSLVTSRHRAAAFWMMLGGQLWPVNRDT